MADFGLDYNASTQPSSVGATIGLNFSGTTLKGQIQQVGSFVIQLTPAGNISETILSGIVWPLAQTIGAALPALGSNLLTSFSFTLATMSPQTTSVMGETMTVTPSNLSLGSNGDMLMLSGSLSIS